MEEHKGAIVMPNKFANPNSQKVADNVVKYGYDSYVNLIHDINEPGCVDYVGGLPCDDTYWTTSDAYPTAFTLGDFGYQSVEDRIRAKLEWLNAFGGANNGMRYEAYCGYPIVVGSPGDIHCIYKPLSNIVDTDAACHANGCLKTYAAYGINPNNGKPYKIQTDMWDGNKTTPSPLGITDTTGGAVIDIVAPQYINEVIRNGFTARANALLAAMLVWYEKTGYVGSGSTWQLGQLMFCMRVASMDNTIQFSTAEKMLWSLQDAAGYLPNSYKGAGMPGEGHDPENQDAGLLPYSQRCVERIQNLEGEFDGV